MQIDNIDITLEHIGRKVLYIPSYANGDKTHKDCEQGIITSISDQYVFVKYGPDRWNPVSKATNPRNLTFINEAKQ